MGLGARLHSAPCLLECAGGGGRQKIKKQHSDPTVVPPTGLMGVRPLHSSPRLSELMQRSPLPTILGSPSRVSHRACVCLRAPIVWTQSDPCSPHTSQAIPPFEFPRPPSSPNLLNFLTQQGLVSAPCGCRPGPPESREAGFQGPTGTPSHRWSDNTKGFGRSGVHLH